MNITKSKKNFVRNRINFFENLERNKTNILLNVNSEISQLPCIKQVNKTKKPKRKKIKESHLCPICKIQLHSEQEMNDHYANSHLMNEYCRCNKCGNIFNNDNAFTNHKCNVPEVLADGSYAILADNIPTNVNGEYQCPYCTNKYISVDFLGEHFIITHNDYESLTKLDDDIIHIGFPGFELLEYIGMIEYKEKEEIDEVCQICNDNYENKIIRMKCCAQILCDLCFQTNAEKTDSIICIFCKHDHTVTTSNYIEVMEQDDNIVNSRWEQWWRDHIDIFC